MTAMVVYGYAVEWTSGYFLLSIEPFFDFDYCFHCIIRKTKKLSGIPGRGCSYNGFHGNAPPEKGRFVKLAVSLPKVLSRAIGEDV